MVLTAKIHIFFDTKEKNCIHSPTILYFHPLAPFGARCFLPTFSVLSPYFSVPRTEDVACRLVFTFVRVMPGGHRPFVGV